jgi:SAM-dependent methyltransferase
MTRTTFPPFVCPNCRTPLTTLVNAYGCHECGRRYPVVAGIPDLRIESDRYLDLDEDRAKAMMLDDLGLDFAGTIHAYWQRTPEVPAPLAERYATNALGDERRLSSHLDRLASLGTTTGVLVDMGCGTGGLVAEAARRGFAAVGVDIALRWLVVARKRMEERGVRALVVAADAARPPFAHATFDTCVSTESLEHTSDQRGFLNGCRLMVRPGGCVYLCTANRFSLLVEPTVGLFGVGWLPRRIAPSYVRWRRNTRYQHFRAVSRSELLAIAGPSDRVRIGPAVLPVADSRGRARLSNIYQHLSRIAPTRALLVRVGPYLEFVEIPAPRRQLES